QAEDGIRDGHVTGVQTCALPIFVLEEIELAELPQGQLLAAAPAEISKPLQGERGSVVGKILEAGRRACGKKVFSQIGGNIADIRSEERRVGKECRCRRSARRVYE